MYATSLPDLAARKQIDVALGILVGLRRCSVDDAFRELAAAVHQTGVPLGDTASALIALAQRDHTPPGVPDQVAARLWGHLF